MALGVDRRLVHFEVHVQRGSRWTIELVAAEEAAACERARHYLQRAEVGGVKVWKEVHDPASGRTAGRIVLAEAKPPPRDRWRFARWTRPAPGQPEPEGHTSRAGAAPRPEAPDGWPVAALSIGGGCAALVALAVLAAIGQWAPLR
jgi:hypothetical protein